MAQITEVPPPGNRKSVTRELVETVILALVIALAIRTFLVEVYYVDGSSMAATLHDRDRVLVNKLVYRLHPPQPGDVVVFRYPRNPKQEFIKRVVGVAGDRVEIRSGRVYVNGQLFHEAPSALVSTDNYPERVVGPDSVWVLGDNRDHSEDSRIFGEVPLANISGEAFFRLWPLSRACRFVKPGELIQGGGVLVCP